MLESKKMIINIYMYKAIIENKSQDEMVKKKLQVSEEYISCNNQHNNPLPELVTVTTNQYQNNKLVLEQQTNIKIVYVVQDYMFNTISETYMCMKGIQIVVQHGLNKRFQKLSYINDTSAYDNNRPFKQKGSWLGSIKLGRKELSQIQKV